MLLIACTGLFFCISSIQSIDEIELQLSESRDSIQLLKEEITHLNHRQLGDLVNPVMMTVTNDLDRSGERSLSDKMIQNVRTLSYSLVDAEWNLKDSLKAFELSPERGRLILWLSGTSMDPNSFRKIKQQTDFSGADLRSAPMDSLNLSFAQLPKANLSEANLRNTDLSNADLQKTIFTKAFMDGSLFQYSDLNRANMSWGEINYADLSFSNMAGINLRSASVRHSNLNSSKLDFSNLEGTFFNESNLSNSDLTGANANYANFENADLSKAILKLTTLEGSNLLGARLDSVRVGRSDWFEYLKEGNIKGIEEIIATYKIEPAPGTNSDHILVKKN